MRRSVIGAAIVALGLFGSACNTQGSGGGGGDLAGSIEIDGSSTVYPISQAVAEAFQGENGDVQTAVGQSGTGGGFEVTHDAKAASMADKQVSLRDGVLAR